MSLLMQLVDNLEIADLETTRLYEAEGDDSEYLASHERHWTLREAINSVPARTFPELQAKARAAEIELERDADDCFGPGSFLELSRSLINDLKAMQPAKQASHLVGNEPSVVA
jgi:hypothetical protein